MTETPGRFDAGGDAREEWSLITETREWKAVTDPSRCERIARKLGKRVAEIKQVNSRDLPYICIFEDKTDE